MTNLVIDIGNTFAKISVFINDSIVFVSQEKEVNNQSVSGIIHQYKVQNVIISSVKKQDNLFFNHFKDLKIFHFNNQLPIPIKNGYATPATLGADRLAGVIGAKKIFPDNAVLVIDAGTCITYDFIDEAGLYAGGSISPGLNMRFKAMHHFTGKLPEIAVNEAVNTFENVYGINTQESLISGVVNGLLFEAEGFISKYNHQQSNLRVILCGGDSTFFDTRLKNSIFAHQILLEPNLVMIGLNTVVNYQHDKKN